MAQHVGMDMTETGPFSSRREDIVYGLPGKRLGRWVTQDVTALQGVGV